VNANGCNTTVLKIEIFARGRRGDPPPRHLESPRRADAHDRCHNGSLGSRALLTLHFNYITLLRNVSSAFSHMGYSVSHCEAWQRPKGSAAG
jgi:hypothetical protein